MKGNPEHLDEFSYLQAKSGLVFIYWQGSLIKTLSGIEAARFLDKINHANPDEAGLIMAKATGNFKRGNERPSPSD